MWLALTYLAVGLVVASLIVLEGLVQKLWIAAPRYYYTFGVLIFILLWPIFLLDRGVYPGDYFRHRMKAKS